MENFAILALFHEKLCYSVTFPLKTMLSAIFSSTFPWKFHGKNAIPPFFHRKLRFSASFPWKTVLWGNLSSYQWKTQSLSNFPMENPAIQQLLHWKFCSSANFPYKTVQFSNFSMENCSATFHWKTVFSVTFQWKNFAFRQIFNKKNMFFSVNFPWKTVLFNNFSKEIRPI